VAAAGGETVAAASEGSAVEEEARELFSIAE